MLQRPNGVTTSHSYDQASRLTRLLHSNAQTEAIEDFNYTYNLDDEIDSIRSFFSGQLLTTAKTASPADAANRIAQVGASSFSFDNKGRTILNATAEGPTSYEWDARGRMKEATLPNGQQVSYQYDALGRRASRTASGVTTSFLYDGADVVLDQGSDSSLVEYISGGEVDEKLRQSTANGPLYFLQDHLGSTAALLDATGGVVERMQYEAFGQSAGSTITRYGYTGRERDDLTGLLYYRARWYDPQQGRFITEDPIGMQGGMNFYGYVDGSPINATDPAGLYPPSHPYCVSLLSKIAALEALIKTKVGQMHEDKLGLPWRAPGDKQTPRISRYGHEMIINRLKAKKAEYEGMYAAKCNDPEPPKCPVPVPVPVPSPETVNNLNKLGRPFQTELDLRTYSAQEKLQFWKYATLAGALVSAVLLGGALGIVVVPELGPGPAPVPVH